MKSVRQLTLVSAAIGILVSIAIYLSEYGTHWEWLEKAGYPGLVAVFAVWGLHGGPGAPVVYVVTNAIFYGLITFCFGLGFVFVHKRRKGNADQ